MITRTEKKNIIRQEIIDSARNYSDYLAGKTFLYVFANEFFEVVFPSDHFLHLTGVETALDKKNFYRKSKREQLTNQQFYFSSRHPYATAKKKLPCLKRLSELTTNMVCILKEMHIQSVVYKLSVTNLEFTLGLTEDIDSNEHKKSGLFLPMSLRIEDKSVENSDDGDIVDYIFSKSASDSKYNTMLVQDKEKILVDSVRDLIDENLIKHIDKDNLKR